MHWEGALPKHVSAALYGVGARLDEDPSLFFTLRKVNVNELISEAVTQKTDELLMKAGRKSRRSIVNDDLSAVFGIELESDDSIPNAQPGVDKVEVVSAAVTGKRRGRPPKAEAVIAPAVKPVSGTGKRRGRPPKNQKS